MRRKIFGGYRKLNTTICSSLSVKLTKPLEESHLCLSHSTCRLSVWICSLDYSESAFVSGQTERWWMILFSAGTEPCWTLFTCGSHSFPLLLVRTRSQLRRQICTRKQTNQWEPSKLCQATRGMKRRVFFSHSVKHFPWTHHPRLRDFMTRLRMMLWRLQEWSFSPLPAGWCFPLWLEWSPTRFSSFSFTTRVTSLNRTVISVTFETSLESIDSLQILRRARIWLQQVK